MDHITVDFNEFFQVVTEMKSDGVKKVTLSIVENDDPDDGAPDFLVLSTRDPRDPGIEIEYDYIDAASES